ncbi:MAG: sulfatase-like hydrolase/transferase [Desulfobacterales bacterium]|nr:sulfatase-like hydrolase/transferase [Desulfobacterales bacterium]
MITPADQKPRFFLSSIWPGISPPASTRLMLRFFILLLLFFTLVRILFYALYGGLANHLNLPILARSFLVGMQFDIATTAYLLFPWILPMHLPFTRDRGNRLRRGLTVCLIIFGIVTSLIAVSDCIYYANAAKRISYEPLLFLNIGDKLAEFAFGEYPILMPFLLACVLFYWGAAGYWFRRIPISPDHSTAFVRVRIMCWGLLLIGLSLVGIAGGARSTSLRIGDAYFSNDIVVNHASLNPVFTFLQHLFEDREIYNVMPPEAALETVRAAVAAPGEQFTDERYPLVRNFAGKLTGGSYNVVLIMVESLTASFMGTYGDAVGATPNMDRIASRGIVFERFFSSGSRSSHGVFATLFSVPAQLGSPVMHSTLILHNFRSLAQILQDHGYETLFIYGGVYEFTNAHGVLKHGGFETIIGEPLPADPPIARKTWGFDDEHMFARLHHELSKPSDKPRLAVLFTQNLHGRDVPQKFLKLKGGQKYGQETPYHSYYNLAFYTDWCIGQFFADAREQAYFENTIFIITADHTRHLIPNLYQNYRIPFILYAPRLLSPARYNTVGSQPDVLPTVLGLLNLKTRYASFGRDLMRVAARNEPGFAYLMLGDSIGWAEGPLILQDLLSESSPRLYDYIENPALTENYASKQTEIARLYRSKARSFMQISRQLLDENRIFPPGFNRPSSHLSEKE